ncbi:hypothetical protein O3P69_010175 [Scylla paramamosain]|uniref:Zinc finger CHCC-type domain-containing protein n=1 Tax=Scylla paramamosain TaxID=85552 RepID=A0AAW0TRX3_SCYPA
MANLARSWMSLPRLAASRRVCGSLTALHTSAPAQDQSPTHTGQVFDKDDYRNARFMTTPRQTNTRWAANLIKEVPPKAVQGRIAACDGGPGALGHPRVYINLETAEDTTEILDENSLILGCMAIQ